MRAPAAECAQNWTGPKDKQKAPQSPSELARRECTYPAYAALVRTLRRHKKTQRTSNKRVSRKQSKPPVNIINPTQSSGARHRRRAACEPQGCGAARVASSSECSSSQRRVCALVFPKQQGALGRREPKGSAAPRDAPCPSSLNTSSRFSSFSFFPRRRFLPPLPAAVLSENGVFWNTRERGVGTALSGRLCGPALRAPHVQAHPCSSA